MERGDIVLSLIIVIVASSNPVVNAASCTGGKADVVFLLDASDSMGFDNFKLARRFVQNISTALDVAQDKTRIGVIRFASTAEVMFHLNRYSNRKAVEDAVGKITTVFSGTLTHLALRLLRNATAEENGGRAAGRVPQFGLVITDGQSADRTNTIIEARKVKAAGIMVLAVGIGKETNAVELQQMASNNATDVFQVSDFSTLYASESQVIGRICAVAGGIFSKGMSIQANANMFFATLCLLTVTRRWLLE